MLPEDLGIPALATVEDWPYGRLIGTAAFAVAVLVIRYAVLRLIRRRSDVLTETQRWWMSAVRNLSVGLILAGLVLIWSAEIADAALSLTAIAVALAIATKELILCISGAIWRGASGTFSIGDWVEIGPHRGEVIDETAFSTVIQEVDDASRFTGRTISIPNGLLLSQPILNQNFRKRFLVHEFKLYAEPGCDVLAVREAMKNALGAAQADFADLARRYAGVIQSRAGIRLAGIEPEVRLGTTDFAKTVFTCSLFCPREKALEVEDRVFRAFVAAGGIALPAMLSPQSAAAAE